MKRWTVTYTLDKEHYEAEHVDGKTYTEAYVNTMRRHPNALITDVEEV